ncbi:hypothetical protein BpHYR1_001220 [Brachionus plicatilis]|uniref:Uncharacterized protein n=1 Tax=Brachionus plicatilis TaxID=10195 RepID=A0A3M7SUD9_BRAPC|nr:hypothetical protein BpHYR1_001220 [Brachionus plicatilis]
MENRAFHVCKISLKLFCYLKLKKIFETSHFYNLLLLSLRILGFFLHLTIPYGRNKGNRDLIFTFRLVNVKYYRSLSKTLGTSSFFCALLGSCCSIDSRALLVTGWPCALPSNQPFTEDEIQAPSMYAANSGSIFVHFSKNNFDAFLNIVSVIES